ncbi:hypothetical protein, partial [Klebsiella pneumoniae]|uniref:hypothetical protein n=1 Tax=Klebsiella pneumoniae TaxID=573 RepID=UPI00272FE3D5
YTVDQGDAFFRPIAKVARLQDNSARESSFCGALRCAVERTRRPITLKNGKPFQLIPHRSGAEGWPE